MKEKDHIWEADIRQKALEHEFDFDPSAWEEMSQLLDKVVIPAPDTKAGPATDSNIGGSWKVITFSALLVGLIALWYLNRPVETKSDLSSQLDNTTEEVFLSKKKKDTTLSSPKLIQKTANDLVQSVSQESNFYNKKSNDRNSINTTPTQPLEPDANENLESAEEVNKENPPIRQSIESLDFLPSAQDIPLLEIPIKPIELDIKILKKKRVRDKNKIYPDVIENY